MTNLMKNLLVVLISALVGIVVSLLVVVLAHAQQNKAGMTTEVNTNFPDNTINLITPAITRSTVTDIINSYQQAPQVRAVSITSDTLLTTDFGNVVRYNNASPIAVSLAQATGAFTSYNVYVQNVGAGAVTITPTTSQINGAATLVLAQGAGAHIVSDGTNYQLANAPAPASVGNSQLAAAAANSVKCNNTASPATPLDCTTLQVNNLTRKVLTPYDFGAVGDGATDDTTAVNNAIAATVTGTAQDAKCLYLPGASHFRLTANVTITMPSTSHGPCIFGDTGQNSRLQFDNGFGLKLTSSGAMFYGYLANFGITCNVSGFCFTVSNSTTDPINSFFIANVTVNNNNATNASGVIFNGVFTSRIMMTVNCDGVGVGTAVGVRFNNGTMNSVKMSIGNCLTGLNLTNNTNAVVANVFDGMDLEVNSTSLLIDGTAVQRNTFLGGQFIATNVGNVSINATAGQGNAFYNPNLGGSGTFCSTQTGTAFYFFGSAIGTCGTGAGSYGELLDANGHHSYLGPVPTISSCTTGSIVSGSNDTSGQVNMGTAQTSCKINFAHSFANTPTCVIQALDNGASAAVNGIATTTQLQINSTTAISHWDWNCQGT